MIVPTPGSEAQRRESLDYFRCWNDGDTESNRIAPTPSRVIIGRAEIAKERKAIKKDIHKNVKSINKMVKKIIRNRDELQ